MQVTALLVVHISIHALFAEGDAADYWRAWWASISIHALFAEGDGARVCIP